MQKNYKTSKGITLIALVITIIVMLILVGVTINVATSGGLFDTARDAASKTTYDAEKTEILDYMYGDQEIYNAQTGELNLLTLKNKLENKGWICISISSTELKIKKTEKGEIHTITSSGKIDEENKEGQTVVDRTGLAVGDYIDYTPDDKTASPYTTLTSANTGSSSNSTSISQDSLKWQILKINDDGSMDLIGSATSQSIYFQGALGYNNGVYLMNDICEKLYSRGSIKARSVSLEDFEYWLNKSTSGVQARADYGKGNTYEYGKENHYTGSNSYRPDIFGKTENESDSYYTSPTTSTYTPASGTATADNNLDVKQTDYSTDINETNYSEGYKALTSNTYAWVASRSADCGSGSAVFGLRFAGSVLSGAYMFHSHANTGYYSSGLRPVVSLGSNVQITASSTASTSSGTPHSITKY